jgi:hypothetical protein
VLEGIWIYLSFMLAYVLSLEMLMMFYFTWEQGKLSHELLAPNRSKYKQNEKTLANTLKKRGLIFLASLIVPAILIVGIPLIRKSDDTYSPPNFRPTRIIFMLICLGFFFFTA